MAMIPMLAKAFKDGGMGIDSLASAGKQGVETIGTAQQMPPPQMPPVRTRWSEPAIPPSAGPPLAPPPGQGPPGGARRHQHSGPDRLAGRRCRQDGAGGGRSARRGADGPSRQSMAEKKQPYDDRDRLADYRAVFGSAEGKRVLHDLIARHYVLGSTFSSEATIMAHAEGQRDGCPANPALHADAARRHPEGARTTVLQQFELEPLDDRP